MMRGLVPAALWSLGLCVVVGARMASATDRPIIGVLAQSYNYNDHDVHYLPASYVKYVESAGARVVAVPTNISMEEVDVLYASLNGVIFPGGGADPSKGSEMFNVATRIYNNAAADHAKGETFPIYGICLGFQLLSIVIAEGALALDKTAGTENVSLPITLRDHGSVYSKASPSQLTTLTTTNSTVNFHHYGIYTDTFDKSKPLSTKATVLSTNLDTVGHEFVSSLECVNQPCFGTQFHPEKVSYEWEASQKIDRSGANVDAMRVFIDHFMDLARESTHAFPSPAVEASALVYNSDSIFLPNAHIQQIYIF